jgi:hypothetical protein
MLQLFFFHHPFPLYPPLYTSTLLPPLSVSFAFEHKSLIVSHPVNERTTSFSLSTPDPTHRFLKLCCFYLRGHNHRADTVHQAKWTITVCSSISSPPSSHHIPSSKPSQNNNDRLTHSRQQVHTSGYPRTRHDHPRSPLQ